MQNEQSQRVGTSARLDALAVSKRVFFSEFIQSRTHCGDTILHQCFVGHWTSSVAGTAGILKWSLLSLYTTFTPILHHEGRRCRPQEDIENGVPPSCCSTQTNCAPATSCTNHTTRGPWLGAALITRPAIGHLINELLNT
jgi:hypothetical protein